MSERLWDHTELDALGEHDRSRGMAQIVEPQPSDTGPGEERLKAARDAARRDRTTRRSGEDEITIQPQSADGESHLGLGPALIAERGDCECGELDRAPRAVGLRGHQPVDRLALLAELDGRAAKGGDGDRRGDQEVLSTRPTSWTATYRVTVMAPVRVSTSTSAAWAPTATDSTDRGRRRSLFAGLGPTRQPTTASGTLERWRSRP